ncbi:DUF4394 domain-containing protein [Hymenobacter endophyticus]|uniref:DUF4394 domain-containing protein n=1 Tax=Hymenobacter endophyticus TaxID=3076335 RepID=A0ABU3TIH3_9BACT|nr:DUF4394 domain-containing protein [Hymenobacter endophyticus]MDU0371142.1 DUF4394 domain-containing protein [Hymenobacter endophyticus]
MSTSSTRRKAFQRGGLLLGALGLLGFSSASAQTVYGLSSTASPDVVSLVSFDATTPGTITSTVAITGFTAGQAIVGIDFRPNTGELFALGYNSSSTQAQLYTINRTTGIVTPVGSALTLDLGTNILRIGFDFNPTVDRIRVTAGNRKNFRLNPNNGALAFTDGTLTYAATDANAAQTPGVGSSAYTNSYIGATGTTLYNLDEANNRLVSQIPPNDGTLNSIGTLGTSVNGAIQASDLDIYFNPTTGTNTAYLSVATPTGLTAATTTLYTVNLANGATTQVGNIGTGAFVAVTDIAFQITRPATLPAVTGNLAYALAGTNLLTFDTAQPSLIRTSVGITGVPTTQTIVGMDVRPLNNALYALGYNATDQTGQLYTINAATGVATSVSNVLALPLGTGSIGFDFNPTVDRIRIVGVNRANFRINPNDGTAAPTVDGTITYATSPADVNSAATPALGSVAYTNSYGGPADASRTTTLYGYDEALNVLVTQNPPNNGTLNTVGASGVTVTAGQNVDIDIFSSAAGTNTAYLTATTGTSANSSLYSLNLTTGAATSPVVIGNGVTVRDIAIAGAAGVTTGTRQPAVATGFSLYPNPVTDAAQVTFRLPRAGRTELILTDALGRTVERSTAGSLAAGQHTLDWQPTNRRAGVYFLRLTVDGASAGTQRVLVQ